MILINWNQMRSKENLLRLSKAAEVQAIESHRRAKNHI